MFNIFGDMGFEEAELRIYIGETMVEQHRLQLPRMIMEQQYIQTVRQIIQNKPQPMSVELVVIENICDEMGKILKVLNNSVRAYNYTIE